MGQSFLLEHGSGIRRQYLREIGDPQGIRAGCLELAVHPVRRLSRFRIGTAAAARGHGAARSLIVVRTALPRVAPFMRLISRAAVQRATSRPSRRNCRQTLRTP
jgi:hypothetical protein